jgi:hypothetical protein
MKTKQFLFFLFAGILVLTGCKKEESGPVTTLQKIQGKWTVVSILPATDTTFDYLEFTTNGICRFGAASFSMDFIYTVTDTEVLITLNGTAAVPYTIVTLTDNSLVLKSQNQTITLKK